MLAAAMARYGYGDERTLLRFGPNPSSKYITTYFRQKFFIQDASTVTGGSVTLAIADGRKGVQCVYVFVEVECCRLKVQCFVSCAGAVVYINGVEVARSNMPAGTVTYVVGTINQLTY